MTTHLTTDLYLYVEGMAKICGFSQSQMLSHIVSDHFKQALNIVGDHFKQAVKKGPKRSK